MWHKIFKFAGLLVVVVFLVITLAFTSHESRNIACRNIEVGFSPDDIIKINNSEILKLVKSADNSIVGKTLDKINAEIIEKEIEKHKAILKAEVYKVLVKDSASYKGILTVKVKHRRPVVRIVSENGNYYLDKQGGKIPVSTQYTANVLAVTGKITEKFAVEELLPFILYIEGDGFWEAQVEQVHVENDGDVLLIPLVGDQIIELGSLDNYEVKLRNMRAFYNQVLAANKWDKYKSVSLKYSNQIVAKKR
jgi:cell division protein FtsQ